VPDGMKQLDGKVVLVVGASAGIGADAARVFARDGASVMLAARTEGSLRELADELTTSGFDAGYVIGDVSVGADVARFVDATVERFGRLDGAFNNAAISDAGRQDEVTEEAFDRILAVNVKGVWHCLREEMRAMREQGSGSIVNMSSVGGTRASAGHGVYPMTKHAVIGLTRQAAHDDGPFGVRVNVLAPGPIETEMLAHTRAAIPGGVEKRIAATPLRKVGTGTEVGNTASWLLSDLASHISGVVLPVDGGYSA